MDEIDVEGPVGRYTMLFDDEHNKATHVVFGSLDGDNPQIFDLEYDPEFYVLPVQEYEDRGLQVLLNARPERWTVFRVKKHDHA